MNFYEYVCRVYKSQMTLMILMEQVRGEEASHQKNKYDTTRVVFFSSSHFSYLKFAHVFDIYFCAMLPLVLLPLHFGINSFILLLDIFIIHDGPA